jgi:hypothetical protein
MSSEPEINVDRFQHRPTDAITALLPNSRAVDGALQDLRDVGVDISAVEVLHGREGSRILDRTGQEHGLRTRVVRWFQNLGYDENILAVYEEALDDGQSLLTVPCPADSRYRVAGLLAANGAHGVIYFTANGAETLSGP